MRIPATKDTVTTEMELCAHMIWYLSKDAYAFGVGDEIMWDINQALISLEHAHKKLTGGKKWGE